MLSCFLNVNIMFINHASHLVCGTNFIVNRGRRSQPFSPFKPEIIMMGGSFGPLEDLGAPPPPPENCEIYVELGNAIFSILDEIFRQKIDLDQI